MYWIAIIVLAIIAFSFLKLYWKGVNERNFMRGFLIQILLDEETYNFQKEGLKKLISGIESKDATELSHRVNSSVDRLISQLGSNALLAAHSLLWQTKKES